jgi:N-acetyltransferase
VDGEGRQLLENVGGAARGARHDLGVAADELVEVLLTFHARVLVDRHGNECTVRVVERWTCPTLEGRLVRLEPLSDDHGDGLWAASRDPRIWKWLPVVQPLHRDEWAAWMGRALEAAAAGTEIPFATVSRRTELVLGSTRFLALRPEHLSVEIGWTWLTPAAWGSGANADAKRLMLAYAFESWGCHRVELKTDALNEHARSAMEAFGAVFEGVHRKHMLVRHDDRRDSAWYSVLDDEWPAVRSLLER